MTDAQFDALVETLSQQAERRPRLYKLRVLALATLGYAYVLAVLASAIGALLGVAAVAMRTRDAGFVLIYGIAVLLPLALTLVHSLWVRMPAPEGILLRRKTAPQLFAELKRLRSLARAPRIHEVRVTDEFNASIVQVPRLGLSSWTKNYLVVGLPMIVGLSPGEFQSVLAHELGHLSRAHGRFSAWIYRVRTIWSRLEASLEYDPQGGSWVLRRFLHWFAPRFNAYSFVMARQQEYEADRFAVKAAGPDFAADALVNAEVRGRFIAEKYWPEVYGAADDQEGPKAPPFRALRDALTREIDPSLSRVWIDEALAAPTTHFDTHPCLTERLAAIGGSARTPARVHECAGHRFLGPKLEWLEAELDEMWWQAARPWWNERFQYAQDSKQSLAELNEKARFRELDAEEAWTLACWTEEFVGPDEALPLYLELLDGGAPNPSAEFAAGRILLERGDASGVELIQSAMRGDSDLRMPGYEWLYVFYSRTGRTREIEAIREKAQEWEAELAQAEAERMQLEASPLLPHDLPKAEVEVLLEELKRYPEVGRAYLVRVEVQHRPDKPCYVLAVRRGWAILRFESNARDERLLDVLIEELSLPDGGIVYILGTQTAAFERRLRRVKGSRIYRRPKFMRRLP